jgi:hypothetical protein
VVVASPCRATPTWGAWHELFARVSGPGKHAQTFKRMSHIGSLQTVEAMLSLDEHFHEMRYLQAMQVYARRFWTDFSHN